MAGSGAAGKSRRTAGLGARGHRHEHLLLPPCIRCRDVPGWFLPTRSPQAGSEGMTVSMKKGTGTPRTPRVFRWATSCQVGVEGVNKGAFLEEEASEKQ